ITPESVERVVQRARLGKGAISEIAYAPNGRLIAVATSLGIYLYTAETFAEVRFIETQSWVDSVAFSPDGRLLASGSWENTVRLWQVSDGALLRTLEGQTV
ncbi:MAG: hypothetical protein NZ693_08635, partial [Thermoflexales bacterium]|nr:hypothetical protein [Thermoflexales bacterium]